MLKEKIHIFYKQLVSGPSPQICLYFQGFQSSDLLNRCVVVWPKKQILIVFQWFLAFFIDIYIFKINLLNCCKNPCRKSPFFVNLTLLKKCPYSELFWSEIFPHFPAFGLNTERYGVSHRYHIYHTDKNVPNQWERHDSKLYNIFKDNNKILDWWE